MGTLPTHATSRRPPEAATAAGGRCRRRNDRPIGAARPKSTRVGGQSTGVEGSRRGPRREEIEEPRQVEAEFRGGVGSEDAGQQQQQPRVDVVARSLPEGNEIIGGSFAGGQFMESV
jgi:hypothetical protein